jgi:hypothetical protein
MIKVTQRMLNKSIIDANKSVTLFVKDNLWASYDNLEGGERMSYRAIINVYGSVDLLGQKEWLDSELRIYKRARGDKLLSIKNLTKVAKAGDIITLDDVVESPDGTDTVYIIITKGDV